MNRYSPYKNQETLNYLNIENLINYYTFNSDEYNVCINTCLIISSYIEYKKYSTNPEDYDILNSIF